MQNLPSNYNVLSPVSFRFSIKKLPNVSFFCQTANIPDLSVGVVARPTPLRDYNTFGDNLEIGTLEISFLVDEDLANYMEIQKWMRDLTSPEKFTGYSTTLANTDDGLGVLGGLISDATLHILTNSMNTNKNIQYKEIFPTNLGALEFTTQDTEITAITATCSFNIADFTIESVT
tara:strand:+ start:1153 stop:1677 length:525 start_codon:yes stop_codon:yes gene_type:complete